MRQAIKTPDFSLNSSTYNNLLAMGDTKVCNYNETPGWTQRGPGSACITLNGCIHHYMKNANSTDPSCGLTCFIFHDISSLAATGKIHQSRISSFPFYNYLQETFVHILNRTASAFVNGPCP
jgi:hypothetical protein